MRKSKRIWLALGSLMVIALLGAVSCGSPQNAATGTTQSGQQQEEMVKVTLHKVDGTAMEKQVPKPKYGGTLNARVTGDTLAHGSDPAFMQPQYQGQEAQAEQLIKGDWARGPAGTNETAWYYWEWPGLDFAAGSLAESWQMPDSETIIFHLRKGVHYAQSDSAASKLVGGREVTADDVVFSLKRLYANTIPGNVLKDTGMKSITAPDKYTVVVKLAPTGQGPFFVFAADLGTIYPPELVQKYGDLKDWHNVVGTGPYIIKDYVPNSHLTYVKNPNYWGHDPILGDQYKLPYMDTIDELTIPNEATYVAALRTGKIDIYRGTEDPENAAQMRKDIPRLQSADLKGGSMTRIAMQLKDPKSPFQDIRVRHAMLMGIDYQSIVKNYFKGQASLLAFPLNNATEFTDLGWYIPLDKLPQATQDLYGYQPDKAKALLAQAGYPNGFKTSVTFGSNNQLDADLAATVKDYWSKIGVQVSLDAKDASTMNKVLENRDYPGMMFDGMWGTPGQYDWFGTNDRRNTSNVSDPKIDALRSQIFVDYWDKKKRTPVMQELFKYTLAQSYYINLPVGYQTAFWQPWVFGWAGESSVGYWGVGQQYGYMWVDQSLKKKMGF